MPPPAPLSGPLVDAARQYGYTDEQIQDYLNTQQAQQIRGDPNWNISEQTQAYESAGGRNVVPESMIERGEGAPAADRFKASFISSPEARFDYFRKQFGTENTTLTPAGEILFKNKKTGKWTSIDESGLSFADLADIAGDLPEAVLSTISPMLWRSKGAISKIKDALKAAVGGAAGSAVRGIVGDDLSARDVASAGVVGAGAQAVTDIGGGRIPSTPAGYLAGKFAKHISDVDRTKFARQSLRLAEETGQPIRSSAIGQNPFLEMLENYASRSSLASPIFKQKEVEADLAAKTRVVQLLRRLPTGARNEEQYGTALSDAIGKELSNLLDARKTVSETQFKFLDEALGRARIIPINNYQTILREEADRLMQSGLEGSDIAAKELFREARLKFGSDRVSADTLQELLSDMGTAAYGKDTGKVFKNLSRDAATRLASLLHKALRKDLDSAIETVPAEMMQIPGATITGGGRAQRAAQALKQAREAYEMASTPIQQLKTLPIMGLMEREATAAPEQIARWVTESARPPSELRNLVKAVQASNPEVAFQMGEHIMRNALDKARVNTPVGFDRKAFLNALPNKDVLDAVFTNVADPRARRLGMGVAEDLSKLLQMVERNTWQSGQSPVLQAAPIPLLRNAFNALKEGDPTQFLATVAFPNQVARFAHLDVEARRKMLESLEATLKAKARGQPPTVSMRAALMKSVQPLTYMGLSYDTSEDIGQGPINPATTFSETLSQR